MLRVIVCGVRDYSNKNHVFKILDDYFPASQNVTLILGGATGVDELARLWAKSRTNAVYETFNADWRTWGRSAGPRRNAEMSKADVDQCIAFQRKEKPGRGTKNMVELAIRQGIHTTVYATEE